MAPRLPRSLSLRGLRPAAGAAASAAGACVGTGAGAALAARTSAEPTWWWCLIIALAFGTFGWCTVALWRSDLRTRRLPNGVVLLAAGAMFGLLSIGSGLSGRAQLLLVPGTAALCSAVLGVGVWWLAKGAVGAGDIKLLPIAVFAALWAVEVASGGLPAFGGALVFSLVLAGSTFLSGIFARFRGQLSFPAGPIILVATWITVLLALQSPMA